MIFVLQDVINQFTAIVTTHVVIENVMYCAIMTVDACKDFDMSILKKELLWNQFRYLDDVKTIKILIK